MVPPSLGSWWGAQGKGRSSSSHPNPQGLIGVCRGRAGSPGDTPIPEVPMGCTGEGQGHLGTPQCPGTGVPGGHTGSQEKGRGSCSHPNPQDLVEVLKGRAGAPGVTPFPGVLVGAQGKGRGSSSHPNSQGHIGVLGGRARAPGDTPMPWNWGPRGTHRESGEGQELLKSPQSLGSHWGARGKDRGSWGHSDTRDRGPRGTHRAQAARGAPRAGIGAGPPEMLRPGGCPKAHGAEGGSCGRGSPFPAPSHPGEEPNPARRRRRRARPGPVLARAEPPPEQHRSRPGAAAAMASPPRAAAA